MAIDYVCRNFVGRNYSNRLKRASLRLISSRAFSLALAVDWDKFDSIRFDGKNFLELREEEERLLRLF